VPDVAHIGFPIVEVAEDGSCIVTKPRGTGGRVTERTVKEQLLYEIGDPANYLSPDVTVSFLSLAVEDLGNDRVRVRGAIGRPRPESLKVSATYRDGFRAAGTLTIIGRDAAQKACRSGEVVLQRVFEAGFGMRDSLIECLGDAGGNEVVLRVAVESESREAVERFTQELMSLVTAGPQGTTGYAEGRPRVHPVVRYWPSLIGRDAVEPRVEILSSDNASSPRVPSPVQSTGHASLGTRGRPAAPTNSPPSRMGSPACLYDIAVARSGDKGTAANIGVIARSQEYWDFLRTWLTAEEVADYFAPFGVESVDRFELPNLAALNFIIRGILRRSLKTDAQGKALGQLLLVLPLPKDFPSK